MTKVLPLANFGMPQCCRQCLTVSGQGFGVMMVLAYSMFTDIAEYLEWKSERQMTALVISASIFAIKTGIAIGGAVPGFVLSAGGFVAGAQQSEAALTGINIAFALVPALVIMPAGIVMLFYKLDHRTIARIEGELSTRRAAIA